MTALAEAIAAAAHRLGTDRDGVLARIGGPIGDAARAAAAQLAGDSRRRRAEWAVRARVPVPAGMRGVHATWIEAALAPLPPRARAAIAGGAGDAVDVWLARWATAGFPPLEQARPGLPRTPADLAQLAPDEATRWLAGIGLDQLALALTGPWIASAARTLGADFALARARVARRPGAFGPQRAALERCMDLVPFDGDARVVIGARTVAPFVAGPQRVALALRMPEPLGERVLAALVAFARADPARGPAWPALVIA